MRKIVSITQWLKLPVLCAICHQYHADNHAICNDCLGLFSHIETACKQCALPIPNTDFLVCGECIRKNPFHDHVIAPYHYEEPLRTLLHEFKYHEGLYLVSFLADLIIRHLSQDANQTECLIPVPLHPHRLKQRGFNQAVELTKYLSRQLKIPYDLSLCKKTINTSPQAMLNWKERHKNLRGAFSIKANAYRHVTLIDDLITTGSTANEIAKTLKKQGVKRVDVWCCARTI